MTNELVEKWKMIVDFVSENFEKKPDLNAMLYLIGIRELGSINEGKFAKDEKVLLMHIAVCKILSYSGHYVLDGFDEFGWPQWKLLKPLPRFDMFEQELFMKQHIIEYFEREEIINFNNNIQ
jgi:hypothetical protein